MPKIIILLAAFIVALGSAQAGQIEAEAACGFDVIKFYDTSDDSERFTQIVGDYQPYSVYMLTIKVNPGDVLDVSGNSEVTNDTTVSWEVVNKLEVFVRNIRKVFEISEETGVNLSRSRHHEALHSDGKWIVSDEVMPQSKAQIMWRWRARPRGNTSRNWLSVGGCLDCLDYGRLTATHYRPSEC